MSKEQEKKNNDFIQFYRNYIDEISALGDENYVAFKLFMFITKHMDPNNSLCVSMKALQEILGYSRQTLSKAVKYLKDKGWLCVLKSGTTNIYILNPEIVWTSWANQKQYCKFKTNVIVSASENAEYLKNREASFKYKHIDDNFIESIKASNKAYEEHVAAMQTSFDPETGEIYEDEPFYG